MSKKKPKPKSPFLGRWQIVSMRAWDEDYLNEEVQAFIEFESGGMGHFQFGLVSGNIDSLETQRDSKPAVEWSWEGNDEMDEASGRGWAVLKGDELHGMIFFHGGDDSEFVAKKKAQSRKGK